MRPDANWRATAANIRADVFVDPTLHCDREVDVQPTIHCAGFEMCRVVFRNAKVHTAVAGFNVEALAPPARTVQVDIDAAVARAALEVTSDVRQFHTAVDGPELDLTIDVPDGDAAHWLS